VTEAGELAKLVDTFIRAAEATENPGYNKAEIASSRYAISKIPGADSQLRVARVG